MTSSSIHPDALEDAQAVARDRFWNLLGWLCFTMFVWLGGGILLFLHGVDSGNPGCCLIGFFLVGAGFLGSGMLLFDILEYRSIIKRPTELSKFVRGEYFGLAPWDD